MSCTEQVFPYGATSADLQGLQVVALPHQTFHEFFLTAVPIMGETPEELFRKTDEAVGKRRARIVSMEIFGIAGSEAAALRKVFGKIDFPVTWLEEGCEQSSPLCGLQVWAVAGLPVEPLRVGGRVLGSVFEVEGLRFCRLGGLLPADISRSRTEQTESVFDLMQTALRAAGMEFRHVARTWFYNFEMLEWYDEFNKVRTTFFKEHGVFDGLVPASTGIGGRNAAGAALTAGLVAIESADGALPAVVVPSPLQCPAPSYGSSFSRAVELDTPGYHRLLISGTASIAPEGHSVHIGDVDAQTRLTFKVAEAILASRAMGWGDVTRLIAYFKYRDDVSAFDRGRAALGIPEMPVLFTANDICRDDLLFEIELDASVQTEG